jgi:hypothetical protein
MNQDCQHCGKSILGNAYRVTSEEAGITLLDMIVCYSCFMEAKSLGLHAQKINVGDKQPSARNGMSHSLRVN